MSKFVNEAGLVRFISRLKKYFAPVDEVTELEGRVTIIEEVCTPDDIDDVVRTAFGESDQITFYINMDDVSFYTCTAKRGQTLLEWYNDDTNSNEGKSVITIMTEDEIRTIVGDSLLYDSRRNLMYGRSIIIANETYETP